MCILNKMDRVSYTNRILMLTKYLDVKLKNINKSRYLIQYIFVDLMILKATQTTNKKLGLT
jgi:hypothetical protein